MLVCEHVVTHGDAERVQNYQNYNLLLSLESEAGPKESSFLRGMTMKTLGHAIPVTPRTILGQMWQDA
jgi:hypothetical protein